MRVSLFLFVLVSGMLFFGCAGPSETAGETTAPADDIGGGAAAGVVTAAEVAQNDKEPSCYVVYQGEVYNVTPYLPDHPSGPKPIAAYCGKADSSFEDAFTAKHGTEFVDDFIGQSTHVGTLAE
jgi:cytochrome b involved in lipid metabolism